MQDSSTSTDASRTALVFGGSGQIGQALCDNLLVTGWRIIAVSRHPQHERANLQWRRGDLEHAPGLPAHVDAIFSCGPLDHFAHWYAQAQVRSTRVVAFGSTSVEVKHDSADAAERDVATRLAQAEGVLFAAAAAVGARATLLRPTLVYGMGRDRNLTRMAALARRNGFLVLPGDATGLRQPVHALDLAAAAQAVVDAPVTWGKAYALGGGEVLRYRDMVARMLAALQPPPRLWVAPAGLFHFALRAAHRFGRMQALGEAMVARMRDDLVFDIGPAQRDFGYAPRAFVVDAAMFGE